jgi:hypothetical protein
MAVDIGVREYHEFGLLHGEQAIFIPEMIITGGQTGADCGGLIGAKALGIPTGGIAPKGFRTENGPQPSLALEYGLVESESDDYAVRTAENIDLADAIISVARDFDSPGSYLTRKIANREQVPLFEIPFPTFIKFEDEFLLNEVRYWLGRFSPPVLMIAGNRESKAKGVQAYTADLLQRIFVDKTR